MQPLAILKGNSPSRDRKWVKTTARLHQRLYGMLRDSQLAGIFAALMLSRSPFPAARPYLALAWLVALSLALCAGVPRLNAAAPPRGLSQLRQGPLSIGYLNAIRNGVGTTPQNIAALNYDGIDIIALAFTLLNADGSLDLTYGSADVY